MNFLGLIQAKKLEPKKGYVLPYLKMPREQKNIIGRSFALYKISGSFLLLNIAEQKNIGFTPSSYLINELNTLIETIRDRHELKTNIEDKIGDGTEIKAPCSTSMGDDKRLYTAEVAGSNPAGPIN